MKCVVIGAGAWGLPAAACLASRGHDVVLVDRYGLLNPWSSSLGPTRLWRMADPDPARVRLAVRGLDAMRRLADRAGTTVHLRRGLLWRDDESLPALMTTLAQAGIEYAHVAADSVGTIFPGFQSDGRDAVWQADAGVVLAAASLRAQFQLFEKFGGTTDFGREVSELSATSGGVRVHFAGGDNVDADAAVVAVGPGATRLLSGIGVDLPLRPYLEQVVHFGDSRRPHAADDFPCLFDGPRDDRPGIYAMPSPGVGYKVGLDIPLRDFDPDDPDRTPDRARTAVLLERVSSDLRGVTANVIDAQLCSWTDSPDGRFVVDVVDGGIVFACGDCGEGFKYSALMGEVLADLAEGRTPDADIAGLSMARFSDGVPASSGPHVLGRH